MSPDMINGSLEAIGGLAVLHHCWTLHRHKQVRGVSVASTALFLVWGIWNLYYYPHLDQFWSFAGAVFITLSNLLYVGMLMRYSEGVALSLAVCAISKAKWAVRDFLGGLVCLVRGHCYDAPYFHPKCLYFCARCGHEMLGRSWDDIKPLDDEERELLDRMDEAYSTYSEARP